MAVGTSKHYDAHLLEGTCLVSSRGSANTPGPALTKLLCTMEEDTSPTSHTENWMRKCGLLLLWEQAKSFMRVILLKDPVAFGG